MRAYPGDGLWEKYERNEIKLIQANIPNQFFADKYSHLPWMIPDAWIIHNPSLSQFDFWNIIKKYTNGDIFFAAECDRNE